MAGVGYGKRHARALLAEKQDVVGHEAELVSRLAAFCREQHQPSRTDGRLEGVEAGMTRDGNMINIVHGSPANSSIIPRETHGLDKVHSRSETGPEPQNGADISGNFGFEKGNAHPG